MSNDWAEPVLAAVLAAALEVTGAEVGLALALEGDLLRVAATTGPPDTLGAGISALAGMAGYVIASGQPLVLTAESGDPRLGEGTASLLGYNPAAIICVPCQSVRGTVGVLELADTDGTFSMSETAAVTRLADIAAIAMAAPSAGGTSAPDPAELSADLRLLAKTNPARYASVAPLIRALFADG